MMLSNTLFVFVYLLTSVYAAPTTSKRRIGGPAPLYRANDRSFSKLAKVSGSNTYIVVLKPDSIKPDDRGNWIDNIFSETPLRKAAPDTQSMVLDWDEGLFNGLAGNFSSDALDILRDQEEVDYVQEDITMYTSAIVQQQNAPWGISRLSTDIAFKGASPFQFNFKYAFDNSGGSGVDIYIIDTGIRTTHREFQGRAKVFRSYGNGQRDTDINGHGTHVAGSAAGATVGVAKLANLLAVKVMEDNGAGSTQNIVSGILASIEAIAASGRPSIINMSLGGPVNKAIDDVVKRGIQAGIPFIVAAGNDSKDANSASPAHLTEVITVGSIDINDNFSTFSNFGDRVDILAPGTNILSCGVNSDNAVANLSGTSMAAPHIAGLAALIMGKERGLDPETLKARIQQLGKDNAIANVPSGTVNDLANNGAFRRPT